MGSKLDPKKVVSSDGLLMSRVISISKHVLISLAISFIISSCATIEEGPKGAHFSLGKKEPIMGGQPTLLSIDVAQSGNLSANVEYLTTLYFEANPKPEISKACFDFSDGSESCVDVKAKDVIYGANPYFRVMIHIPAGTKRINCYVEYIRDGKTHRTNSVTYPVVVLKKPEE